MDMSSLVVHCIAKVNSLALAWKPRPLGPACWAATSAPMRRLQREELMFFTDPSGKILFHTPDADPDMHACPFGCLLPCSRAPLQCFCPQHNSPVLACSWDLNHEPSILGLVHS